MYMHQIRHGNRTEDRWLLHANGGYRGSDARRTFRSNWAQPGGRDQAAHPARLRAGLRRGATPQTTETETQVMVGPAVLEHPTPGHEELTLMTTGRSSCD